jgi:hypothetical protein
MIEIKSITTLSKFTEDIQRLAKEGNINHIDAIVAWCDINKVEIEQVIPLIKKSQVIKAKLEDDAEQLNLLEKSAKLPL